jgi:FdhD protein
MVHIAPMQVNRSQNTPDVAGIRQIQAAHYVDNFPTAQHESVAVESPLDIRINGQSFSVTMSTPGHEAELAHGLLWAEGVLTKSVWYATTQQQLTCALASRVIDLTIPADELGSVKKERRLMATSSCGLCGVASLDGLDAQLDAPLTPTPFSAEQVPQWFAAMRQQQTAFALAGGTHAAAAFNATGDCLAVYEDIGRHNAVDKVIGSLMRTQQLSAATVLAVSGRVSFEIMVKALRAGIATLAAVSAPSSLAIDLARRNNMTLLAFCRERRFTIYSGAQQLKNLSHLEGYDVRIIA